MVWNSEPLPVLLLTRRIRTLNRTFRRCVLSVKAACAELCDTNADSVGYSIPIRMEGPWDVHMDGLQEHEQKEIHSRSMNKNVVEAPVQLCESDRVQKAVLRDRSEDLQCYLTKSQSAEVGLRLTREQHDFLEALFQIQHKPSTVAKKVLAEDLNVTLDKVNVSFE